MRRNSLVHDCWIAADKRSKVHPSQDIALNIDSGRDLDELEALPGQLEHAAFGDIEHRLSALHRIVAGKRPVLDLTDELCHVAFVDDTQAAVLDRDAQSTSREGTDEYNFRGILTDVDEAAGAGEPWPEFTDVQIALLVRLGKPEKGCIKATAIIEVELIGLIDDGLRVRRRPEIQSARGDTSDDPWFGRERDQVDDLFFVCDVCHALGHADTQIDDAVCLELECRAPRDDLSLAHFHWRY